MNNLKILPKQTESNSSSLRTRLKILLSLFFATTLMISCGCDPLRLHYQFEVDYTLENNETSVDSSFMLSIDIPKEVVAHFGDLYNISDREMLFDLVVSDFRNDPSISHFRFPEANSKFDIEVVSGAILNSSGYVQVFPSDDNSSRRIDIKIQPKFKGTYTIALSSFQFRFTNGDDDCDPWHDVTLRNEDAPFENVFSDLEPNQSRMKQGELTHGLLLFKVN